MNAGPITHERTAADKYRPNRALVGKKPLKCLKNK